MLSRPDYATIRIERLDAKGLAALDPAEWDALSAQALVENPFYARQYLLAGLETIDRGKPILAYGLRDAAGTLIGLVPGTRLSVLPVLRSAANLYQFDGTPLIARDQAPAAVSALLAAMRDGRLPKILMLGHVHLDSALMALIDALAPDHGMERLSTNPYPRAYLTKAAGSFEAHIDTVFSKNRLKDIKRTLRRLNEMGTVRLESVTEPEAVRARLEDFLKLENSGWKGEGGTSFAADTGHADFARLAYGGLPGREGLTQVDTLLVDGRPIAANITIRTQGTAFTPKIAYDEELRKLSPGLARDYLIIEAFYANPDQSGMDSAATNANSVLLGMWDQQRMIGTAILGPKGWRTRLAATVSTQYRALRERAKKLLRRS